jgi:hypothetical protein
MSVGTLACASRGGLSVVEVDAGIDRLPGPTVQAAAHSFCLGGCQARGLVLEVENQPELEARVGNRGLDSVPLSELDGASQLRMIVRPFHVEDAPALVDFCVLAPFDRSPYEDEWVTVPRIDLDVDRGSVPNVAQALEPVDVIRFGGLSFAEDDESLELRASGGPSGETPRSGSSKCHGSGDEAE